jgi:tripeptidyl-peptidase-1
VPLDYAKLTCNMVGLLGLRGITTIFSSGDGGLGGACLAPDMKTVEFDSSFPASCPYVTAVGGTSNSTPEVAWDGSSGGFSRYFDQPSWQKATIDSYVKAQVSNETYAYYGQYTNWAGRAFPDVAAHSLDPYFQVIYAGKPDGSGGTSAAAPVWAGIVGLLNDARLRAGKPALGWLNPLIYGVAKDTFIDITGGYTTGCNARGGGIVPGARWNATAGWDPTTGFGTPNFQKLKELVLTL